MPPTPDHPKQIAITERRQNTRFPVLAPLNYFARDTRSQGTLCNISDGGFLCQLSEYLPVGTEVNVFIDWPFGAGDKSTLRVAVHGKILRNAPEGTVIQIVRYDYQVVPEDIGTSPAIYLSHGAA